IMLEDRASDLDEVVVIGYGGAVKKRDITGAISSVSAKEIAERQPINIFDALQGKAAGVLVVNDGGGEPGATRSEEHTSELQSLMRISYAVFCLKKNNNN